jgi:hypothetical protein
MIPNTELVFPQDNVMPVDREALSLLFYERLKILNAARADMSLAAYDALLIELRAGFPFEVVDQVAQVLATQEAANFIRISSR